MVPLRDGTPTTYIFDICRSARRGDVTNEFAGERGKLRISITASSCLFAGKD